LAIHNVLARAHGGFRKTDEFEFNSTLGLYTAWGGRHAPDADRPDLETLCARNNIADLRELGRALFVTAPAALLEEIRTEGTLPHHSKVEIILPKRME
jgi:hypothetical protein